DGKVKVVYKDLPILGEPSRIAALAALASRAQGKHLAFHNALMEYGGKIDHDKIMEIAGSAGLDVAQLQKAMEDPRLKEIIERNMTLASALGVRGTPAFVVGNQFVPGAVDADALRQPIALVSGTLRPVVVATAFNARSSRPLSASTSLAAPRAALVRRSPWPSPSSIACQRASSALTSLAERVTSARSGPTSAQRSMSS